MQYGRTEIYTNEKEITRDNIIKVLRKAYISHLQNANDCKELLRIEKGNQPKIREKVTRTDIDNWVFDNIPNEITNFKLSYNWCNPITFIQHGEKDSGNTNEAEAIAILNEYYMAQGDASKTQALARFVEICGVGYTMVSINTEWKDGESPFTINILDPRFAFVVRSNYYADHRIILGVTFRKDELGNSFFTCYTNEYRFEILNVVKIIDGIKEMEVNKWDIENGYSGVNPIHIIPIVEWIRDYDRMGCFERQLDEIKGVSLLVSDFLNDVDQNTNTIWHGNDVGFEEDENGNVETPQKNDWVLTQTTKDGKQPFIKPLSVEYDYAGILNQITYRTDRIKIKCNVPLLSGNVSNTTGVAESNSTGWANADAEANRLDSIRYGCKTQELKVVLAVCRTNVIADVDDKVKALRYVDAKPNTNRQKNYEMSIKSSTLANLLSHGIYGLHALTYVNMFEDVNQVWTDSKPLIEKYQSSIFDKGEQQTEEKLQTTDGGMEAQVTNSPNIDGMSTEEVVKIEE